MSTYAYSDIYDCAACGEALVYPVDEDGEALDGGDLVCLTCVLSYVVDMRTGTLAAPRVLGASDPMPDSVSIDGAAFRRLNIWGPGCEARSAAFHRLVARAFETRGVWLAQRPDQRLWVPGVGHQFGDW